MMLLDWLLRGLSVCAVAEDEVPADFFEEDAADVDQRRKAAAEARRYPGSATSPAMISQSSGVAGYSDSVTGLLPA